MTLMVYADDTGQIIIYWKHMQWLINASLFKVICRGIWLCKLTYPVIYRLTLNKSDLHQTNTILNIYEMIFSLSNKDNYLWNFMIMISANFAQVNATQTECWCKMNCETDPKTKAGAKENGIRWCQQCINSGAIGRNRAWLAQRLWTETSYVMNTISV